jgi:DNA-3-methyladenine glycosylase II
MSLIGSSFVKAQRHLARRDPVLKRLIVAVGPCTLQVNLDHFAALARSIVSQQISTKAARAILARLEETLAPRPLEAKAVLKLSEQQLRGAGLSAAKTRYLRDLAEKVETGEVPLKDFDAMSDEDVIAYLLPVKGIGRWTAQMFLIFSLGRLDVLPVDDLGLRLGVQAQYALPDPPGKADLAKLAEPWQPYRSVATWYFWRSRGFVPQSS